MMTPATDPMTFWSRALIRLGLILLAVGLAPMGIDYLFLNGAGTLFAAMTLVMVAPIGLVALVVGLIVWGVSKVRK